jgi:hypothetical protein
MSRLERILDHVWFPAMPATRLAFLRIAIGLFAFWYVAQRYTMYLKMAATDPFFFKPLGAVWWMAEPLSTGSFEALMIATLFANAAFVAGWHYRISGPLFGVLLLVLLSYRNSWTMIYHSDNAMVAHVLILGFVAAAADAWSVDAWLHSRRLLARLAEAPPARHWRYGWPVQLLSAATAISYFLAGVAKLAGELGLSWASGEALRSQIAEDTIRKALLGEATSSMAFSLYEYAGLFTLIGVMSMLVEMLAPFALLNRRLGMLWAVNAFGMHWGIFVIMSITFRYQMAGLIFLSFFPVERIVEWVMARLERLTGAGDEPVAQSAAGGAR